MNFNVTVAWSEPKWATSRYLQGLDFFGNSHEQTITAIGGYDTAKVSGVGSDAIAEGWLESGLGRHIEVYDPFCIQCWEGFVNEIDIQIGSETYKVGPMLDLVNRVVVKYSDFSSGANDQTSTANDTVSQALYGVIQKVVNTGKVSATQAAKLRDVYLEENKYPDSTNALGSGSDISLNLGCLGYQHFLKAYSYSNALTGSYTAREKFIDILAASPNAVFSTNYINIEVNSLSVFKKEEDRVPLDAINDLLNLGGGSNDNRRTFGVYDGGVVYIQEVPGMALYNGSRLEPVLRLANEDVVFPWEIRPGQYIYYTGSLPGRFLQTDLANNPTMEFIESVTFGTGGGVATWSVNGGKTHTLPQKLAKLGLGGF